MDILIKLFLTPIVLVVLLLWGARHSNKPVEIILKLLAIACLVYIAFLLYTGLAFSIGADIGIYGYIIVFGFLFSIVKIFMIFISMFTKKNNKKTDSQ